MTFAEAEFRLSSTDKDGITLRAALTARLERVRARGKADRIAELEAQLFPAPAPRPMLYLLAHFYRIRSRKAGHGSGIPPWEWPDLTAYCTHAQVAFCPWEVEILEALDILYVTEGNRLPTGGKES